MSDVEHIDCGHLPTWHRHRDDVAANVSRLSGRRMSDRTVRRLRDAVARGCAELVAAMDGNRISIAAATELSRLPHDLQRQCLSLPPPARRTIVRQLRQGGER